MSFQYSSIGDNTPENREHLEKIGYGVSIVTDHEGDIIKTQINGMYYPSKLPEKIWSRNVINCIGNHQLFKAVSAMRDDSDYMQWFVTEADQAWVNQGMYAPKGSFELCLIKDRYNGKNPIFCSTLVPAHKATLSELQERFKIN